MSDSKPRRSGREALRATVMVSHALAAIAESEIHAGQFETASQTIANVRRSIADANSLFDPAMSTSEAHELGEILRELDHRLRNMAVRLSE